MAAQWQVGERIQNRWDIHKILGGAGKSGMGIVYVVYDHKLREAFAAKTFQEEAFAKNSGIAERFIREAHAWVNLDIHENVTRARFVEEIERKPFLFLEYVSGGDLKGWIGTPRLTEDLPQVLRFAIQFCDGMIHALSKGIKAHRDIKPENCLITEGRTLKVTDFGLAKVFDDASLGDWKEERPHEEERLGVLSVLVSRTGYFAGTPHYAAPEQFADAKHVDVRADVYSFGVMLYQMLTGQLPFRGRSLEEFKRLHKVTPAPVLDGGLSAMNAVLQGCLAKAPEQRFGDFRAVRQRLAEIHEKLTGEAPARPASGAELNALDWYNKGRNLSNLGRPEGAMASYDRALDSRFANQLQLGFDLVEVNPQLEQAWGSQENALGELEPPEEALVCYERALEINPRDELAWINKGNALYKLRRLEESLAAFEQAQSLGHPQAARGIQVVRQAMSGSGGSKLPAGGGGAETKA
jgi:serine/threonine protein kinase